MIIDVSAERKKRKKKKKKKKKKLVTANSRQVRRAGVE